MLQGLTPLFGAQPVDLGLILLLFVEFEMVAGTSGIMFNRDLTDDQVFDELIGSVSQHGERLTRSALSMISTAINRDESPRVPDSIPAPLVESLIQLNDYLRYVTDNIDMHFMIGDLDLDNRLPHLSSVSNNQFAIALRGALLTRAYETMDSRNLARNGFEAQHNEMHLNTKDIEFLRQHNQIRTCCCPPYKLAELVTEIAKSLCENQKPVTIISNGAGAMLPDFMLIKSILLHDPAREIRVALVDPMYQEHRSLYVKMGVYCNATAITDYFSENYDDCNLTVAPYLGVENLAYAHMVDNRACLVWHNDTDILPFKESLPHYKSTIDTMRLLKELNPDSKAVLVEKTIKDLGIVGLKRLNIDQ